MSATSVSAPPQPLRASDTDRERVCHILHQGTGAGMLTLAEADERLAAAYAARFRHELEPLTADVPDDDPRDVANRDATARLHALLLGLFALSVAARAAVAPILARHKVLTGVLVALTLVAGVLSVSWGLTVGEGIEH